MKNESSSRDPLQDLYDLLNELSDKEQPKNNSPQPKLEYTKKQDDLSNEYYTKRSQKDKSLNELSDKEQPQNNLHSELDTKRSQKKDNLLNELSDKEQPQNNSHSELNIERSQYTEITNGKSEKSVNATSTEETLASIFNLLSPTSSNTSQESPASVEKTSDSISDSVAASTEIKNDEEDTDRAYVSQEWILEKEKQIDELANSVNTLIPLIVQLSTVDGDSSEENILKAIVPIIDRVIQQRSQEDQGKMAEAIANILPEAIRQEIRNEPESIGRAIAPEIALSIKEQTTLNEGAIANALGSEMGQAIKKQIETERDAMVDALYPVIGSTISKYMTEVVETINAKVDSAFSPQGIQRKIKARIKGVSEAELILQESLPYNVKAVFLIHKDSGLVISELQTDTAEPLESDLLAGMLTAIRSFANDCFASDSELGEIDYDDFQILLETAGYCYIAVVVTGEPDKQFRDLIRKVLSEVIIKYGDAIENYQGDPTTIPESLQSFLETLIIQEVVKRKDKKFTALWFSIIFILGVVFVPLGMAAYRGWVANRIEKAVAIELDTNPELSVYRLIPEVKKGQLSIKGRVPSTYLRNLAATVSKPIATEENIELNNQIIAVDVPTDPTVTAQEVARLTKALNQNSEGTIETVYRNNTVTIDGLVLNPAAQKNILAAFENIPGVEKVILVTTQQIPNLETRIYFPSGSVEFSASDDAAKIERVINFLDKYPFVKLKIIGHSDRQGNSETNLKLAKERAEAITIALINKGIDPGRLEVAASLNPPPEVTSDRPLWLSRCVRFETFVKE